MTTDDVKVGRLVDGPVAGVDYRGPSTSGTTDPDGAYRYRDGDDLTFSIGALVLGTTPGAATITPVELAGAAAADDPLSVPGVLNRARLLHSLAGGRDVGAGIVVTEPLRDALRGLGPAVDFDGDVEAFAETSRLDVVLAGAGRRLRSIAEVRNQLRRTRAGIRKRTDVPIPLRDGAHLLCDVYEPLDGGAHPVILRVSVYGRAFEQGTIWDAGSLEASERREDRWHSAPRDELGPMVRYSETIATANVYDWVPRGYVCIRADVRGSGATPGVVDPYSVRDAEDYYDAIEWAARQPFCDGAVGTHGASFVAITQFQVAALRPPSLRAMIPFAGDADPYREMTHPGGIFMEGNRRGWLNTLVLPNQRPGVEVADVVGRLAAHPFDEPEDYGVGGSVLAGTDLDGLDVPFLTGISMGQTIHARAGIEAFVRAPTEHKRLVVVDGMYFRFLYQDTLEQQFAFFDRFLRGRGDVDLGSPVRIVVRTGNGSWEWREEPTWPIPGTEHRLLHLDATSTAPELEDGWGQPAVMTWRAPAAAGRRSWSADALATSDPVGPGTVFVSEPMEEELELIGHATARLWVSSSSSDADLFLTLRVVGASGEVIPYAVEDTPPSAPLSHGSLKVSHRRVDPARSTADRPWHTHRRADAAPLRSADEVVLVEVELTPLTARLPAGSRLRLELQPIEGRLGAAGRADDAEGIVAGRRYDRSYHDGATNTVATGPEHLSSLVLPVVARR